MEITEAQVRKLAEEQALQLRAVVDREEARVRPMRLAQEQLRLNVQLARNRLTAAIDRRRVSGTAQELREAEQAVREAERALWEAEGEQRRTGRTVEGPLDAVARLRARLVRVERLAGLRPPLLRPSIFRERATPTTYGLSPNRPLTQGGVRRHREPAED